MGPTDYYRVTFKTQEQDRGRGPHISSNEQLMT